LTLFSFEINVFLHLGGSPVCEDSKPNQIMSSRVKRTGRFGGENNPLPVAGFPSYPLAESALFRFGNGVSEVASDLFHTQYIRAIVSTPAGCNPKLHFGELLFF
jgi:hypothetical protein